MPGPWEVEEKGWSYFQSQRLLFLGGSEPQFESQILHYSDDFEFFTSASKKPIPNPTAIKAGLAHCFPGFWLYGGAEGLHPSCPFFYTLLLGILEGREQLCHFMDTNKSVKIGVVHMLLV